MAEMVICEICTCVGMFMGDDGNYYCRSCGMQSQFAGENIIQVEEGGAEGGLGLYSAAFRRKSVASSFNSRHESESQMEALAEMVKSANLSQGHFSDCKADNDDADEFKVAIVAGETKRDFRMEPQELASELRRVYLEGLQMIIQMQSQALAENFGVSPVICGIAPSLWLRIVASSKVLRSDWYRDVFLAYEHVSGGPYSFSADRDYRRISAWKWSQKLDTEPRIGTDGKRASLLLIQSLKERLPVSMSLVISFLSCHIAREPILPTDIMKWALEGKLPYLAAFTEVDKKFGSSKRFNASIKFLLRPERVPEAYEVELMAGKLAQRIGLKLPPVNYIALSCRFIRELGLSVKELFPAVCRMFDLLKPTGIWISDDPNVLPSRAYVMGMLIIALRMFYNIHGQGYWEKSNTSSQMSQGFYATDDGEPYQQQLESQKMNATIVLHRVNSCYKNYNDLYEFGRDLSSYLKYCRDVIFAGSKMAYDEANMVKHFWKVYETPLEEGCRSESPSETHGKISSFHNVELHELSCSKNGKENIEGIILDMEENGFKYLTPRKFYIDDSYFSYKKKLFHGKEDPVLHADIYILLRACAKIIKMNMHQLLLCVWEIEKSLRWMEFHIADIDHENN